MFRLWKDMIFVLILACAINQLLASKIFLKTNSGVLVSKTNQNKQNNNNSTQKRWSETNQNKQNNNNSTQKRWAETNQNKQNNNNSTQKRWF